jgi:hypothetical protein
LDREKEWPYGGPTPEELARAGAIIIGGIVVVAGIIFLPEVTIPALVAAGASR